MPETTPVIWGQTSDGQDAYVHSCTKAVYNPETGKTLDEEMGTCIPDGGENLPPTPIDADTLQGHAADYFVAQETLDAQRTYSAEEQWTGEHWIDGKKIYQKVMSASDLSTTENNIIPIGVTINNLVRLSGVATLDNGNIIPIPYVTLRNENYESILVQAGKESVIVTGNMEIAEIKIFIEYTKTTE